MSPNRSASIVNVFELSLYVKVTFDPPTNKALTLSSTLSSVKYLLLPSAISVVVKSPTVLVNAPAPSYVMLAPVILKELFAVLTMLDVFALIEITFAEILLSVVIVISVPCASPRK